MNITKIEVKRDPNNNWEACIYVDELPKVTKTEVACIEDSHFHYGENEDGFACFGVSYDRPSFGHEPGYMWSSRCSVFNKLLGKSLMDVTVCVPTPYGTISRYGYFYMDARKVLNLIPEDFYVAEFQSGDEYHFEIISYAEEEADIQSHADWGCEFVCGMLRW